MTVKPAVGGDDFLPKGSHIFPLGGFESSHILPLSGSEVGDFLPKGSRILPLCSFKGSHILPLCGSEVGDFLPKGSRILPLCGSEGSRILPLCGSEAAQASFNSVETNYSLLENAFYAALPEFSLFAHFASSLYADLAASAPTRSIC
jgi:hypothetical protein